jgi:hypothetical protein
MVSFGLSDKRRATRELRYLLSALPLDFLDVQGSCWGNRPMNSDAAWSVVSYFLRYFSSTSTEQISPIPPDLSPVSIRLALLFLLPQEIIRRSPLSSCT